MFHYISDSNSSSNEEDIPGVIVNAKVWEITDEHIAGLNDFLMDNCDLQLIKWGEMNLEDFQLHSTQVRSEEFLIVDQDKLNPAIMTGGKIKNDFIGVKRNNENDIEEEINNTTTPKPSSKNKKLKKNSASDFKTVKNFKEDKDREIKQGREGRESREGREGKENSNNAKEKKRKYYSNYNHIKKEETLERKYTHLLNSNPEGVSPTDNYSFIQTHLESLWENSKKVYISSNGHKDTAQIEEDWEKNKKMNNCMFYELYSFILKNYRIRTEKSNERKGRVKIKSLNEDQIREYVVKIKNLSLPQAQNLRTYLPKNLWRDGNMSFKMDEIPARNLPKFIEYINQCEEENRTNVHHLSWQQALVNKIN
jgi:hypothetical protein